MFCSSIDQLMGIWVVSIFGYFVDCVSRLFPDMYLGMELLGHTVDLFLKIIIIFGWPWGFIAALGLSLAVLSRGYSVAVRAFSSQWLFLSWSRRSRAHGLQ